MKNLIFVFVALVWSVSSYSQDRKWYAGLELGPVQANSGIDIDWSWWTDLPDIEHKDDTLINLVAGYGFDVFHIEFIYSHLGDMGFTFGDYLEYERKVSIAALAARWRWRWVSFRLGYGRAFVNNDITDNTSPGTITHELDSGKKSYSAFIASVGGNFPIKPQFELYAEANLYVWDQDDGEDLYYDDGTDSGYADLAGSSQKATSINFGMRYYFN